MSSFQDLGWFVYNNSGGIGPKELRACSLCLVIQRCLRGTPLGLCLQSYCKRTTLNLEEKTSSVLSALLLIYEPDLLFTMKATNKKRRTIFLEKLSKTVAVKFFITPPKIYENDYFLEISAPEKSHFSIEIYICFIYTLINKYILIIKIITNNE